jgi:hypothetical protein
MQTNMEGSRVQLVAPPWELFSAKFSSFWKYKILLRKPKGKRSLGRYSHRLGDNVRMYLREIRWEVVDWMHLTQDRDQWRAVVNTIMKLQVP